MDIREILKRISKVRLLLNKSLSMTHIIAYYESDKSGDLRLMTLMNLLQDAAQMHINKQGCGVEEMAKQAKAWMAVKYAIRIKRYPRVNEEITISTWVSEGGTLAATREFVVRDSKKTPLIEIVSKWVLVDIVQRKLTELPEVSVWKKNLFTTNYAQPNVKRVDCTARFKVGYDCIDFNQHVNNSFYPLWASESVEREFRLMYSPGEIIISFKKEALFGEEVTVNTQVDELRTSHVIQSEDGKEHARVSIKWVKDNALTKL